MRLVLLGTPGSGKGTQGRALADRFGIPLVSTGELLRRGSAREGEPWRAIRDLLERGELVPDELVLGVLREALDAASASRGYVLDGFPRTVAQASLPEARPSTR